MSEIQLDILTVGSIERDGKHILEAHSSSTMIRSGGKVIVVDTSSSERRDSIRQSLRALKVEPKYVDTVIITHMHGDHTGNNDLFPKARFIAHALENPPSNWEVVTGEKEVAPGVRIVPTPGHSRGSISVFVDAERKYAVTGDALPTEDNHVKKVPPGINYDPVVAMESIKRIVDFADIVVPGHGFPFSV